MGISKSTLHGLLHKLVLAKSYSTKPSHHPNKTQTSKHNNSEIEPTAQTTFRSLLCAARVHSTVKIKKQLLNMVTTVGCEMARQNARRVRVCLDFFSFFFVSRQKRKRFTNTNKQLKKNGLRGSKEKLRSSEITYETLLAMGIPMPTLHHIWHYYKSIQLKNRLCTNAPSNNSLSLLKTNFAKKPKNPV